MDFLHIKLFNNNLYIYLILKKDIWSNINVYNIQKIKIFMRKKFSGITTLLASCFNFSCALNPSVEYKFEIDNYGRSKTSVDARNANYIQLRNHRIGRDITIYGNGEKINLEIMINEPEGIAYEIFVNGKLIGKTFRQFIDLPSRKKSRDNRDFLVSSERD